MLLEDVSLSFLPIPNTPLVVKIKGSNTKENKKEKMKGIIEQDNSVIADTLQESLTAQIISTKKKGR